MTKISEKILVSCHHETAVLNDKLSMGRPTKWVSKNSSAIHNTTHSGVRYLHILIWLMPFSHFSRDKNQNSVAIVHEMTRNYLHFSLARLLFLFTSSFDATVFISNSLLSLLFVDMFLRIYIHFFQTNLAGK